MAKLPQAMGKIDLKKKILNLVSSKSVIFHHNNAIPHEYLAIRQKLREPRWEISMRPPYILDPIIISVSGRTFLEKFNRVIQKFLA